MSTLWNISNLFKSLGLPTNPDDNFSIWNIQDSENPECNLNINLWRFRKDPNISIHFSSWSLFTGEFCRPSLTQSIDSSLHPLLITLSIWGPLPRPVTESKLEERVILEVCPRRAGKVRWQVNKKTKKLKSRRQTLFPPLCHSLQPSLLFSLMIATMPYWLWGLSLPSLQLS